MKILESPGLLTGQEHLFIGSTSDYQKEAPSVYTPGYVVEFPDLLAVARLERRGTALTSLIVADLIDIPDSLVFSVEDIDPITGLTVRDPRVLGILGKNKRIQKIRGRNLDQEFRNALMEREKNTRFRYFLREPNT